MKISRIELINYRRFTNLVIDEIPSTAKIVLMIGPNGSGKTSVFDAMNTWYRRSSYGQATLDNIYHIKGYQPSNVEAYYDYMNNVKISFHNIESPIPGDGAAFSEFSNRIKGKFYFRTSYRNDPDFSTTSVNRLTSPVDSVSFSNFLQTDQTVATNYQRLIGATIDGLFKNEDVNKTVDALRSEIIGKINKSIRNVLYDVELTSFGDPLSNGSFYFKKGLSGSFHYKNLSSGEKSAFDIILDLLVKIDFYESAIYCIDEPETHMHTKLQANLLGEMYDILPNDGQLWISTHSLGILKRAKDIEDKYPGTIAFLDFDGWNFDENINIKPSSIDRAIWQKFVDVALDDFSTIIAPKKVVFCEGDPKGTKNKNFDSQVYSKIFGANFPEVSFVSIGSSNDLHNSENVGILAIKQVLQNVDTTIVTDRDDKSPDEVQECLSIGIRVLSERHLESYLLNDEIISKLCTSNGKPHLLANAITIKEEAISAAVARGYPDDDVKAASGDIYVKLKKLLELKACGNNSEAFLRDTMAPLISPETDTYQRLRAEVLER